MRATLLGFFVVIGILATGCSSNSSPENRTLTLGDIGWDESVAVANLSKVLLEERIGYEEVELQTLDVALLFEGVGNGDLDAFQDIWLPNHQQLLDEQGDSVVQLDPWFQGQTSFGIAVPSYMEDVTSLEDLNETHVDEILGIEPGAVIMQRIPDEVIPTYHLKQSLVESSTAGMLAEVDSRYNNREEFSFVAWSPHWMNQRYNIRMLDDPEDALGELNDPAHISTIVNKDLRQNDPVAYTFLDAITLNEEQLDDLEDTINEVGDPLEGARQWAEANREVVQPWIDAAENAQEA